MSLGESLVSNRLNILCSDELQVLIRDRSLLLPLFDIKPVSVVMLITDSLANQEILVFLSRDGLVKPNATRWSNTIESNLTS